MGRAVEKSKNAFSCLTTMRCRYEELLKMFGSLQESEKCQETVKGTGLFLRRAHKFHTQGWLRRKGYSRTKRIR